MKSFNLAEFCILIGCLLKRTSSWLFGGYLKSFVIFLLIGLFFSESILAKNKIEFRVMTYNMHGIPCIQKQKYPDIFRRFRIGRCPDNTYWSQTIKGRFEKLTQILNDLHASGELPDVLLLQEAFYADISIMDNSALSDLLLNSPYSYYIQGPRPRVKNLVGAALAYLFHIPGIVDSGLVILSKYPIISGTRKAFFKCRSTDCLANKGVLHAQIKLPGSQNSIDIFNTHYQAGSRFDSLKIKQNIDSVDLIQKVRSKSQSSIQIYGGDFNFRNSQPSFSDFIKKTQMHHAGKLCHRMGQGACRWNKANPSAWILGSLLDHQFISRTNRDTKILPRYLEYGQFKYKNRDLSDHPYFLVDYEIEFE